MAFSNEPFMAMSDLATQLSSEMLRQQIKATTELMQSCADEMHQLSLAKGVDDVVATHSRFIAKSSPKLLGHAQDTLDSLMSGAMQYRKLLEKTLAASRQSSL